MAIFAFLFVNAATATTVLSEDAESGSPPVTSTTLAQYIRTDSIDLGVLNWKQNPWFAFYMDYGTGLSLPTTQIQARPRFTLMAPLPPPTSPFPRPSMVCTQLKARARCFCCSAMTVVILMSLISRQLHCTGRSFQAPKSNSLAIPRSARSRFDALPPLFRRESPVCVRSHGPRMGCLACMCPDHF
jgi:hypothetical protein